MANFDIEVWKTRARAILAEGRSSSKAIPFATSFLAAFYGPGSSQMKAFNARMSEASRNDVTAASTQQWHAIGVIENTLSEIESGLIVNLRAQVAGEVLSELVALGKEILMDDNDAAKNVSAVLIAAAFEDLMRRMGNELAGVVGRPKLEDAVVALKNAGILNGSEVGIALSYLQFRNHSLHADWSKVEKSQIQSCIGFVEALLLKHFS